MSETENRVAQLLREAVDEIEKYRSCESAYFLLKYTLSGIDKIINEKGLKYDFTLDNLILLTLLFMGKNTRKYKFFVAMFLIYDELCKRYKLQEPLFMFRWTKTYFIYSYRVEAHLKMLIQNSYILAKRDGLGLTGVGEKEAHNLKLMLKKEEVDRISEIAKKIERMRLNELKIYIKKSLFFNQTYNQTAY
jgi:hypothetical protein